MKTPAQMVDDVLAEAERGDWSPPIPRYIAPFEWAPVDWSDEFKRLMQHHQLETDTLLAVIREMRRRIKAHELEHLNWQAICHSADCEGMRWQSRARAWKACARKWWRLWRRGVEG